MKRYSVTVVAICSLSAESIVTELYYVVLGIPTLLFGTVAVPVAGALLLTIHRLHFKRKFTVLVEWKVLLVMSILFAASEFTWYDSISHIGAAKVVLVDNPLEVLIVVGLAWVFLSERLDRMQMVGAAVVLTGVLISLSVSTLKTGDAVFGIGEIEAISTAVTAGIAITLSVKLMQRHGAVQVTGFMVLISGLMLALATTTVWLFDLSITSFSTRLTTTTTTTTTTYMWLVLAPLLPLFVFLLQNVSYLRVGAAITSVVLQANIILTVVIQVVLVYTLAIPMAAPENIALAALGGLISIGGIATVLLSERKQGDVLVQKKK